MTLQPPLHSLCHCDTEGRASGGLEELLMVRLSSPGGGGETGETGWDCVFQGRDAGQASAAHAQAAAALAHAPSAQAQAAGAQAQAAAAHGQAPSAQAQAAAAHAQAPSAQAQAAAAQAQAQVIVTTLKEEK